MSIDMATPQPRFNHTHYAGFWLRFFAATIDLIVLFTPVQMVTDSLLGDAHEYWSIGISLVVFLVVYAWMFSSKWQASLGMWLLRFHICDVHGERISYGRALWWGVTSLIGSIISCAPSLYMAIRFDMADVTQFTFSCLQQQVSAEDCSAEVEKMVNIPFANYEMLSYATSALTFFMLIIWALSIALPKDKTGFHNLICGTRFIKGRPPESGKEAMPSV